MLSTSGTSTENVKEIQQLRLVPQQLFEVSISADQNQIVGGSYDVQFCDFSVRLPGFVQYAPTSNQSQIIVITEESDVNQVWRDFGVYSGYPIRISTDETQANQQTTVYMIYLDSCAADAATDNCVVVIPLSQPYNGATIRNGRGSVWGCDFSKSVATILSSAGPAQVKDAIEEVVGEGAVYAVSQGSSGTINFNITFDESLEYLYARLDTGDLRGNVVAGTLKIHSSGLDTSEAFDMVGQGWKGAFRIKLGADITDLISPGISPEALAQELQSLSLVGPDVRVAQSVLGWDYSITFVNEIGDVEPLQVVYEEANVIHPLGTRIAVETTRQGQATLDGLFEITWNGVNGTIPVDATAESLRSLLESTFGLTDVSIQRSGPSPSNGYDWTVTYVGDCPFQTNKNLLVVQEPCHISLQVGDRTAALLTGNDAQLTIRQPLLAELPLTLNWVEDSRIPEALSPAVSSDNTNFELESPGMYTFSSGGRTRTVFTGALPPRAFAFPSQIEVLSPRNFATLNGTGSVARTSSPLATYKWTLRQAPKPNTGQVSQPSKALTVALDLDTAGEFVYQLEVSDALGLSGCTTVNVVTRFPPLVDPLSDIDISPGSNLRVECVVAQGSLPLTVSWLFNGELLQAQSTNTLTLNTVQEYDEGNYTCFASNSYGASSESFLLRVRDAPTISTSPRTMAGASPGSTVSFTCAATGEAPLYLHWQFSYTVLGPWQDLVAMATTPSQLSVEDVSSDDEGYYRCVANNSIGSVISDLAQLEILTAPTNVSLVATPLQNAYDPRVALILTCHADGLNLEYRWIRDGDRLQGAVNRTLSFNSLNESDYGEYRCEAQNLAGSAISSKFILVVNTAPVFTLQPFSASVDPGEMFAFVVNATGKQPIQYLWSYNGEYLYGDEYYTNRLVLNTVSKDDEGEYLAVAYNDIGFSKSAVVSLSVNDPPAIESQPQDTTVDPGETVVLSCNASGTPDLDFYWVRAHESGLDDTEQVSTGIESFGKYSATLTFDAVVLDDEGLYACVASNSAGEDISSFAKLSVNRAPWIIVHPNDTYVDPGAEARLRVVAGGAAPLTYQWRVDGRPIPDSNSATLVVSNAEIANEGGYDCRVTNRLNPTPGVLTSIANLIIARPPQIVDVGDTTVVRDPLEQASLYAAVTGAPPMYYTIYLAPSQAVFSGQIEESGEIRVQLNVTETDEGQYFFFVYNRLGNVSSAEVSVIVNDPPVITTAVQRMTVDPQSNVTLECIVEASPAVSFVTWIFESIGGGRETPTSTGGFTLDLTMVSQADEGLYYCFAENSAGSTQKLVADVTVRDPPTIVKIVPLPEERRLNVDPGEVITFEALTTGLQPITYSWYRNDVLVKKSTENALAVAAETESDVGVFYVVAENALGEDTSEIFYLFLNAPARVLNFTVVPEVPRVLPNAFVLFRCRSSGAPPIAFTWLEDGQELSNSSVHAITKVAPDVSVLQIAQANADFHSGTYTCMVSNTANPVGFTSEGIELVVVVAPALQAGYPRDKNQFPGQSITFECRADEGSPPFEVEWYQGSQEQVKIESEASSKFQYAPLVSARTSTLTITDAVEVDQDFYSCKMCNELGCVRSRLAALGVYDSPLITYQFPTAEDATVEVDPMSRLALVVSASGLEPLSFQWRKAISDSPVDTGDRVFYDPSVCEKANEPCALVFKNVTDQDEGTYYCRVSNALGGISSSIVEVHVRDPPLLVGEWPQVLENSCPGVSFNFDLNFTGSQPIAVSWYFQRTEPMEDLSDILFQSVSLESGNEHRFFLREPNAAQHSGFYVFKAHNSAGQYVSSVAYLNVNTGPSAAADADGLSPKHAITLPQTFTELRGIASQRVVAYSWSVISIPEEKDTEVTLLEPFSSVCDVIGLDVPGTYVFMLTVTGYLGCLDTDTVVVTVNNPPVAIADSVTFAIGHQDAVLDGSRSYDLDSGIMAFKWSLLEPAPGVLIEHANVSTTRILGISYPRTLRVMLTVWDAESVKTSVIITVDAIEVVFSQLQGQRVVGRTQACDAQTISWSINGGLVDFGKELMYLLLVDVLTGEIEVIEKRTGQSFLQPDTSMYSFLWQPVSTILDRPFTINIAFGDTGMLARSNPVNVNTPFRYKSSYSECSASCGSGARSVVSQCVELSQSACTNATQEFTVNDVQCNSFQAPGDTEDCLLRACNEPQWRAGPWVLGDSVAARIVECLDDSGTIISSDLCDSRELVPDRLSLLNEQVQVIPSDCPVSFAQFHQCFDSVSGLPWFGSPSCLETTDLMQGSSCTGQWRAEEWQLDEITSSRAYRSVQCVDDSGCAEANKPKESVELLSSFHLKLNTFFWEVSSPWSACVDGTQSRHVTCVNAYYEVEDPGKCLDSIKPVAVRSCDGKCGPSGVLVLDDICVCPFGWSGVNCTVPVAVCVRNGGVISKEGDCCSSGLVGSDGRCCSAGTRLDRLGMCCDARVDICGECGGSGRFIDITGVCCSNMLDSSGKCCHSGIVDRCGVCDGTGLSCYLTIDLEISPGHDGTLRAVLNQSHGLRSFKVFRSDNKSVVKFGAMASLGSRTSDLKAKLSGLAENSSAIFSFGHRGVCGNGLCEVGERCYTSEIHPQCCPIDCPVSFYKACSLGCSDHGVCNHRAGVCECFEGYAGSSCSRCSENAWFSAVAKQCVLLTALARPGSALTATSIREEVALWPIILGVLLFSVACLVFVFVARRKRREDRNSAFKLEKSHKVVSQPKADGKLKYDVGIDDHPQEDAEYDHSGWLWKRCRPGKDGKGVWQQWYVVLDMNEMWYFESDSYFQDHSWATAKEQESIRKKMQLTERGCIDLRRLSHVEIPALKRESHKERFPFDFVTTDERPVNWMASSTADRDTWLEKLGRYVHVELDSRPESFQKLELEEDISEFERPEEEDVEDLDDEEVDVMV